MNYQINELIRFGKKSRRLSSELGRLRPRPTPLQVYGRTGRRSNRKVQLNPGVPMLKCLVVIVRRIYRFKPQVQ
jgi:hypothetical protein